MEPWIASHCITTTTSLHAPMNERTQSRAQTAAAEKLGSEEEAEQSCMGLHCCSARSPTNPKIDRGIPNNGTSNNNPGHQGEVVHQQQGTTMAKAILNNDGLKDVLRQAKQPNSKLVVLEFTAAWSEPFKFMRPAVEDVASSFKDHAEFYTLDVELFKTFARNTRVEALPTFLLVRDTILERVVGVSKEDLQRSIQKHICTSDIAVHRVQEY